MTWQAFPSRQITGTPMYYYGYVGRRRIEGNCCYDEAGDAMPHRGQQAAQRCAGREAARLNRAAKEKADCQRAVQRAGEDFVDGIEQ